MRIISPPPDELDAPAAVEAVVVLVADAAGADAELLVLLELLPQPARAATVAAKQPRMIGFGT